MAPLRLLGVPWAPLEPPRILLHSSLQAGGGQGGAAAQGGAQQLEALRAELREKAAEVERWQGLTQPSLRARTADMGD